MNTTNYEILQEWMSYLAGQPWAIALGAIAAFWLFMQMLSNNWAGGKLFEREYAWISSAVATVIAFLLFVLPHVSWELMLSLLIVAAFISLTFLMRKHWGKKKKKVTK